MADLWSEFPADPGLLLGAVQDQVAMHAPLVPVVPPLHELAREQSQPYARPKPWRDPLEWTLLKHAVQLALVASVVLVVLHGGRAPVLALSYAATGLLLMGVMVIADRRLFEGRDPAFEIVEFITPDPMPAPATPAVRQGPLVPIVQQMQGVLPQHVEVT